jgi:hypothetical protein
MDLRRLEVWIDDPVTTSSTAPNPVVESQPNGFNEIEDADLAEYYFVDTPNEFSSGYLVSLDESQGGKAKLTSKPYDHKVLGVVSEYAGVTLGRYHENALPVALTGRVITAVSSENGPIKPGDLLTSSSTSGFAMKATKAGYIVGRALTSFEEEGFGSVLANINVHYADPNQIELTALEISTDSAQLATDSALLRLDSENNLVASVSAGAKFVWENTAGQVVAWVSDTGEALFSKVTALVGDFTKLVFGEAVVKKDAKTAGEGSFASGETEVFIESDKVNEESLINLTPTSKTNGLSLYIKEKKVGEGFVVALERNAGDQPEQATASATTAIKFTWFILNQE